MSKLKIVIGQGSCGIAAGAAKVYDALENAVKEGKLDAELAITGCIGMCYLEPIADVFTEENAEKTGLYIDKSVDLMPMFLGK